MGKLQANGKYVSRTKNFYIVAMICCAVYLALALVTDICFAVKPLKALFSEGRPLNADDFARNSFLLNAIDAIGYLAMTAYAIFSLFTYSNLFRAYAPDKVMRYNLFSLLGYVFSAVFRSCVDFVYKQERRLRRLRRLRKRNEKKILYGFIRKRKAAIT